MALHPRRIAMKLAPVAVGVCSVALFASSAARASIPGNIEERSNAGLLHVCRDFEPGHPKYIVCDEQVGSDPQSPYTGSECAAEGLPAECRIDFIPRPRLSGKLTLINDDLPLDGDGNFNGEPQAALIIELGLHWKRVTLVEAFDGTKIGNWNQFSESELVSNDVFEFTNADHSAFQFSNGNLTDLGLEIRDLTQQAHPNVDLSDAVPVLVYVDQMKEPSDGSNSGLGSANTYRVIVRFARVRP
jgi:hypothetical protein